MLRRKSHVYRQYQTDENGVITDPDVWVDILRIDVASLRAYGLADVGLADGQVINYFFDWGDDRDPPVMRESETLRLYNPSDSSVFIDIKLIKRTRIVLPASQSGNSGQAVMYAFLNHQSGPHVAHRDVIKLRIPNNDLNNEIAFDPVNAGNDQPASTRRGKGLGNFIYRVDWDAYADALIDGQKDTDQHISVEVPQHFTLLFPNSSMTDSPGQDVSFSLKIDGSKTEQHPYGVEALFDKVGDDEFVYRLDPLQIIVNVSWGSSLAVEFFNGAT